MNVSNTALNTTISNSNGVKVSTIEHLMGALFGIGIDNALIEIEIYRSITREDIMEVANKYLNPNQRLDMDYVKKQ